MTWVGVLVESAKRAHEAWRWPMPVPMPSENLPKCWRDGCHNEPKSATGLCHSCIEELRRWSHP